MTEIAPFAHPDPTSPEERARLIESGQFGRIFTDHMVTARWTADKGWHDAALVAHAPFSIAPASAVLHYGQEIFEGMKAYLSDDGHILLFRPEENARRFARSAHRMAMPPVPEALFIEAVEALVRADHIWAPGDEGSLYLRPFMFATEVYLGVRSSQEYTFCVIASPVGAYFKGGAKPITVWVSEDYVRATQGGTGATKCGGNYAASMIAQAEATRNGCDQVLFLDAVEHRWIEELGGMNVFFVFKDGRLLTPALGGTILPGITRDAILAMARDQGLTVEEGPYAFDQWQADAASGHLVEMFVCGTAAGVAPVGQMRHANGVAMISDGKEGPMTAQLRERLSGIQRGSLEDPFGWRKEVLGLSG